MWDASSRWSSVPGSAWSIETMTIGKRTSLQFGNENIFIPGVQDNLNPVDHDSEFFSEIDCFLGYFKVSKFFVISEKFDCRILYEKWLTRNRLFIKFKIEVNNWIVLEN